MNEVTDGNIDSLYVSMGDVKGISDKILLLKDDQHIRQVLKQEAQNIVFEMNPDKYYADLEALYHSIF